MAESSSATTTSAEYTTASSRATSPPAAPPDVAGSIGTSNGHNIFGSDVVGNAPGDQENVPTSLLFAGGLADNGGQTLTIALREAGDNPALGGADPDTSPTTDQRGMARPQPAGTVPDIGAVELAVPNPSTAQRKTRSRARGATTFCAAQPRSTSSAAAPAATGCGASPATTS